MSCSDMSNAGGSFAADSQIPPDGSPVVVSSMPSVELCAAASPMLLRAVDEPTEPVLVLTDWYAPHEDSPTPNDIVEELISRYSVGLPRIPLHAVVVHLAGGTSAAVSPMDSYENFAGWRNWLRTYQLYSYSSSDSGDETDPEMPALVDAGTHPQTPAVIDDSFTSAEYVGRRVLINGQVIPIPRTPDEEPGETGHGLVSRDHLVASFEELD